MLSYPGTAKGLGLHYSEKMVYCLNRSGEIHGISNEIDEDGQFCKDREVTSMTPETAQRYLAGYHTMTDFIEAVW
jgi:hypothetical protein